MLPAGFASISQAKETGPWLRGASTASAFQLLAMSKVTGSSHAEPAAPIDPPLVAAVSCGPDVSAVAVGRADAFDSSPSAASEQPVSTPASNATWAIRSHVFPAPTSMAVSPSVQWWYRKESG